MSESEESPNEGEMEEESNSENSEESKGKTIFYGFPRDALRKEDLIEFRDIIDDSRFYLEFSEDGGNLMIKREKEEGDSIDWNSILQEE